jgi:hypothetical protein
MGNDFVGYTSTAQVRFIFVAVTFVSNALLFSCLLASSVHHPQVCVFGRQGLLYHYTSKGWIYF